MTEDVSDIFDNTDEIDMPFAASATSLEDLDKRMVMYVRVTVKGSRLFPTHLVALCSFCFCPGCLAYSVAVESARMVTTKSQLWKYIGEIGLSPLLAALQKSLERQVGFKHYSCRRKLLCGHSGTDHEPITLYMRHLAWW